jgi:hypothetical protein
MGDGGLAELCERPLTPALSPLCGEREMNGAFLFFNVESVVPVC